MPYGPRRPLKKTIFFKFAIGPTAAKTGFLLLLTLCGIDKVHAVRPVDNNNALYALSKPEVQLTECSGGRKNDKRTHSAMLTKHSRL